MLALLARLAKASALLPIEEKTFGSAASADIAELSPASFWNAAALLAMRASAAAFDAALWNALALFAKLLNDEPFARIACSACGCPASAAKAAECAAMADRALGCPARRAKADPFWAIAARAEFDTPADCNWWAALAALFTAADRACWWPARPLNPAELAARALNTFGSARIADIAALSLASFPKAEALVARCASEEAFDTASRNALAFWAKCAKFDGFCRIADSASGCEASA